MHICDFRFRGKTLGEPCMGAQGQARKLCRENMHRPPGRLTPVMPEIEGVYPLRKAEFCIGCGFPRVLPLPCGHITKK